MPNTATAVGRPPRRPSPANPPTLEDEGMVDAFLRALDRRDGVYMLACSDVGISYHALHRQRIRDPRFAAEMQERIRHARQARAMRLQQLVDEHLEAHLGGTLEVVRDADGNPVYRRDPRTGELELDDDLEPVPVMRSPVSVKALTDLRREARGQVDGLDGPASTSVSVTASAAAATASPSLPRRPRLVRPAAPSGSSDVEDAEVLPDGAEEPCGAAQGRDG